MRIVKKFFKDDKTEFVSGVFDSVITGHDYPIPFERMEFHIRDSDVTAIEGESAIICINYDNPLVMEKDRKGISILLRHELFRLMFKMDLPRAVEDIIIGRELIKRGFGDDLFYMYYNYVAAARVSTAEDYVKLNLPWIIFRGYDDYNSELLKRLSRKCRKKFPETRRLFAMLCTLSNKNLRHAAEEHRVVTCS